MDRKLRICHIITRMIVGGAQENTLLSAIGQRKKGHEVTLITGPSKGPEGKLLEKIKLSNIEIEIVKIDQLIRAINPIMDTIAYFKIKNFLERRKFDIVHTHSSKAGIIGRAAAWKAKIPYIVHTVHGQPFHRYGNPIANELFKFAERWAAKRCHKIYAVSEAMINQCVEASIAPRSKYMLVYSGMDIDNFINANVDLALREKLKIPENAPVIGTVARLFKLKGYEYLIPAAKGVISQYPNAIFLIVGDGILKEKIVKQIKKLQIENNFRFTGLVPPEEIPKYIKLMDILVHLSLREGLPRAVVQALASGVPAIGFRLDGTPEVIEDGKNGYLVEPESIKGVTTAILSILNDSTKRERMGRNGQKIVIEKFHYQSMVDTLLEDYIKGVDSVDKI